MNVVSLITRMATSDERVGSVYSTDTPGQEMVHLPGGPLWDSKVFPHNTQNSA